MAKAKESAVVVFRKKQYVVLQNYRSGKLRWKEDTMIRLDPDMTTPYISAQIITPLNTAINDGVWPPTKTTPATKMKAATKEAKEKPTLEETKKATKGAKATNKKLLGNTLQAKVQAIKKSTTKKEKLKEEPKKSTPKSTLSEDKLAAIKAGGRNTSGNQDKK